MYNKAKVFSILFIFFYLNIFSQNKDFELSNIWKSGELYPQRMVDVISSDDGLYYTWINNNSIEKTDYKTGKITELIFNGNDFSDLGSIDNYEINYKSGLILIETNKERIYRHSYKANVSIYNIKDKVLFSITKEIGKVQLAEISPNGLYVSYVQNNNLFIYSLLNKETIQITNDGEKNSIINGATDWVYEEEFSIPKAYYWSPLSTNIAFIRFDESKVKQMSMLTYNSELYPGLNQFKYPKAGEDNSLVDVYIYDLEKNKSIKVDIGNETDIYIPRIKWTSDNNVLSIQKLNRHQNHLDLIFANSSDGKSKIIMSENNKYYIDITDDLYFLKNNKGYIWTSEKDGFKHAYYYSLDGQLINQITKGYWELINVYGVNEDLSKLYYSSTEVSSIEKHIYSIDITGKNKTRLSNNIGSNSAEFSSSFKYYINTFSNSTTPFNYTVNNSLNGKEVRTIIDNKLFLENFNKYSICKKEYFKIINKNGDSLNSYIIYPKDFDSTKEYPLFMVLYGGPGSQEVSNSWSYDYWYQYMAQRGFVIACVDNRGTGFKGEEFKKCTYLNLGKYEVEDQIYAAKLLGQRSYIDKNRIGIFGWSFGGYMSSLCLFIGNDVFKTAIAVAPVTNWKYYDNIYTERFMRTPLENKEGYDNYSPINHVDKLKGNFLLIHGSADDNVHVQNSNELSIALVNNNKYFDFMVYTNSNHSIRTGRNTRYHLYTKMSNFLFDNL